MLVLTTPGGFLIPQLHPSENFFLVQDRTFLYKFWLSRLISQTFLLKLQATLLGVGMDILWKLPLIDLKVQQHINERLSCNVLQPEATVYFQFFLDPIFYPSRVFATNSLLRSNKLQKKIRHFLSKQCNGSKHLNFTNQGPLPLVLKAPPFCTPPLCCLIRRLGSTVNPM